MSDYELFEYVRAQVAATSGDAPYPCVEFAPEVLQSLSAEQAVFLAERFGAGVLMRLPESEQRFFEWLRGSAPEVWHDVWDSDDEEDNEDDGNGEHTSPQAELYTVGLGLLPEIIQEDRGFPICDLVREQNFYFSLKSLNAEEAKPFVDAAVSAVETGERLSLAQMLMLEIRRAPIDVWRFAYLYRLPVAEAKKTALQLIQDGLLKHGSTREELSAINEL
jgi:hypothetical protein